MAYESWLDTLLTYASMLPAVVVCIVGAVFAYQRRMRHPWVTRIVMIACIGQLALIIGSHFIWPALIEMAGPGIVLQLFSMLTSCAYAAFFGLLVWSSLAGREVDE